MAEDNRQAAKNAARAAAELKKQKKRKWCPIVAPEMFNSRQIGESLLDDASMLMNRHITANMMQLTGDMKRQNISIMFKVVDIKEGKALTAPVKFEISPSSLRRLAKRDKDKLSDSFVVKTADDILVRIKPLMITNNQAKGSVRAALVKNCRAATKELVNKIKFEQLIMDLVTNKFQKELKEKLHKTYPLRILEVKTLAIEKRKKKESVEEEELLKLKKLQELKDLEKLEESEVEEKQKSE
ncbi:MAG: hypothetical protein ACP5NV_02795 [Candidatus Woesearchaeota archaeon]